MALTPRPARLSLAAAALFPLVMSLPARAQVATASGTVVGSDDQGSHVRAFRGIPYAAPPLGALRWREPQGVAPWKEPRKATEFGPRCMQARIFDDMVFRDSPSEDCLYLNVWTPTAASRLPVMVWIHGGGFVAGSASEPRQDGERLATKGVVVVSLNYRLGAFGFLAHPELTKESPHHVSGNYGLLDQIAALRWVKSNIAAFGGDPSNVTIFGESAGSASVCALMASPLARGLFHKAIGESGALFSPREGSLSPRSLAKSEEQGLDFAASLGASTLEALRAKPAEDVLKASLNPSFRSGPITDGYVLGQDAWSVYGQGDQSHTPLLAGWNADEIRAAVTLAPEKPTVTSFENHVRETFGDSAEGVLKGYPAATDPEALESAAALGSDMFIGYSTWKWVEMHLATGGHAVYTYSFDRKVPVPRDLKIHGVPATSADIGARHAGEIEYVFGTLDSLPDVPFEPADRKLSDLLMTYWTNFARSSDPNGKSLPHWPEYGKEGSFAVLHLGDETAAVPDSRRPRYLALDQFFSRRRQ